jgi:hypothetical protein
MLAPRTYTNYDIIITESPNFSQTAGLQFAKHDEPELEYDFAHLTGRSPCANLDSNLIGMLAEPTGKAGARPALSRNCIPD